MTLPNLLGLGTQRAATTWLDYALREHPDIFMSSHRKEVHFFDRSYNKGINWYSKHFPPSSISSKYKWIGEITADYLYDSRVPVRISESLSECLFIVILRNPVDRAYSQYCYNIKNSNYQKTFNDFVNEKKDALERGLYAEQLSRYFSLFARDQFLLMVFEELVARPWDAIQDVARFLEIDPQGFESIDLGKKFNTSRPAKRPKAYAKAKRLATWARDHEVNWVVNSAKKIGVAKWFGTGDKVPPLDPDARWVLLDLFREDICQLEALTEKSFDIWLRAPG